MPKRARHTVGVIVSQGRHVRGTLIREKPGSQGKPGGRDQRRGRYRSAYPVSST